MPRFYLVNVRHHPHAQKEFVRIWGTSCGERASKWGVGLGCYMHIFMFPWQTVVNLLSPLTEQDYSMQGETLAIAMETEWETEWHRFYEPDPLLITLEAISHPS